VSFIVVIVVYNDSRVFTYQAKMTRGSLHLTIIAVVLFPLLLAACSPAEAPAGSNTSPPDTVQNSGGLTLSNALRRNCQRDGPSRGFDSVGLDAGATAVDFTLKDVDGTEFSLSRLLAEKPVVMVFGSFT